MVGIKGYAVYQFKLTKFNEALIAKLLMRQANNINQVMRYALESVFASAARVANHTPLNPDGLPRYARSDGVGVSW